MSKIEVVERAGKGKGLIATAKILKDETAVVFEGTEIITPNTSIYDLQLGDERYLVLEGPCRFVNHSCVPNTGFKNDRVLVAIRDILPGEEVTLDYGMAEFELYRPFYCECGKPSCREYVEGFVTLPKHLMRRYFDSGLFTPYLQRKAELVLPALECNS